MVVRSQETELRSISTGIALVPLATHVLVLLVKVRIDGALSRHVQELPASASSLFALDFLTEGLRHISTHVIGAALYVLPKIVGKPNGDAHICLAVCMTMWKTMVHTSRRLCRSISSP